jgi:hypothetical protein
MSWAKLDDQFHAHRKATKAWRGHPRALGLHLLAMSYCAGHLTDGLVDDEFVEEKIPQTRERSAATDALVDAELWEREDTGWRIHDWLDFNPSKADTLAKRQKEADRKARGRASQRGECPPNVHPDTGEVSARTTSGVRADETDPSVGPDPTRPDPGTNGFRDAVSDVVELHAHPGHKAA